MSTTTTVTSICHVAEEFAKLQGLKDFEIERVVRSREDGKDEWIVQLGFQDIDPLIEDDGQCAIIIVDAQSEEPRLLEGL
ncbi:MAG: hypothetical protein R3C19_24220 [Planctomycetaceae bacterium]